MTLTVRELVRPSFTEWRATAIGPTGVSAASSAAVAYAELATAMAESGAEAFQEKVCCASGTRDEVRSARRAALEARSLDATTPWAYLRGRDDDDGAVCVQAWGVARRTDAVALSTVGTGSVRGRLLRSGDLRMLWLGSIDGRDAAATLPLGIRAQTAGMFESAERALGAAGLTFHDVVRTWIYVSELLAGYRELNAVRTAFYAARGIGAGSDARPFPASTGIQGRASTEACVMDLLAIRAGADAARVTPLDRSDRQGSAFSYGSSFSRAMSVEIEGRQTVLVSGTSSIGPDGATLYPDDPDRQAVETLLGIASLVEPLGATLRDVAAGTLFTRDARALEAFERAALTLGVPELPLARVRADVCRPDLSLEVEAVVYVPDDIAARGDVARSGTSSGARS